ncbi:hypothetical protein CV632_01110 [Geobacillus thermodenitrificans]|uniref:DUF4044 domain-containing protein n=1 Tax=Geobacillus thermodenitrificans (strain NG80-2) TaxID=420246 RepID=A4IQN9_GEOTN|nr:hypothetical protein GTNG_2294 [Geobacillus thermodenitrificans NG80-2]PJW21954.1 hypothetical protein CV632_01110 [Geobacillus thermodenitrificans]
MYIRHFDKKSFFLFFLVRSAACGYNKNRTADGEEEKPLSRKTQKFVVYLMLICMLLTTLLAGISMWF